jgi:hypothetical protein
MRLNADGQAGYGRADTLTANEEGAVVWDDAQNRPVVCDGTDWVPLGDAGIPSCSNGETLEYSSGAWVCASGNNSAGTVAYWTTPGIYTWTVPTSVTEIFLRCIGGGGSGEPRNNGQGDQGEASLVQTDEGTKLCEAQGGSAGEDGAEIIAKPLKGWGARGLSNNPSGATFGDELGKSAQSDSWKVGQGNTSLIGDAGGGGGGATLVVLDDGTIIGGEDGGAPTASQTGQGGDFGGSSGGSRRNGGGSGATANNQVMVTPGETLTIVVGAGGAADPTGDPDAIARGGHGAAAIFYPWDKPYITGQFTPE